MKKLSIEEKAKAYDEALKYAMIYYKDGNEDMKMMMKTCFPVLVEESEGEKIRKWIIENIQETLDVNGFFENQKIMAKKALSWLEKQGEQKPSWSEEDKRHLNSIIKRTVAYGDSSIHGLINNDIEWLKSLKDRVQPQQEWSEEDDIWLNNLIYHFEIGLSIEHERVASWLKFLRGRVHPKSQWKPSDEQIEALESATENCAYSEYQDCLKDLIEQLKKLKG